jgi:hypothetical protein
MGKCPTDRLYLAVLLTLRFPENYTQPHLFQDVGECSACHTGSMLG